LTGLQPFQKIHVNSTRRHHNVTHPEASGQRQFFQVGLYRVQVAAEDKRKAELRRRVLVPKTKTFFNIVFLNVKPYSQSRVVSEKFAAPSSGYKMIEVKYIVKRPIVYQTAPSCSSLTPFP
jgi:hypothetical protein